MGKRVKYAAGCAAIVTATLGFEARPLSAQQQASSTVQFLVDVSGSMAGSRLNMAKEALNAGVDALRENQAAGLRSYAGSCSNRGTLRVSPGLANRTQLRNAISSLRAGGGTPTPAALEGAAGDIRSLTGTRTVILISDGQSSCGDPCPTARRLKDELGVEFRAFTVGFQAPEAAEGELKCVADVTGGQYFSAQDTEGIAEAINEALEADAPAYVAVGDSTTTGFSIPTCREDRESSFVGCVGTPPATPYPERLATADSTLSDLRRVGMWGYTIREAIEDFDAGENADGGWTPQLALAQQATSLVTVSLGANDMQFSDIPFWLTRCATIKQKSFLGRVYDVDIDVREGACTRAARGRAQADALQGDLDAMFAALDVADAAGAEVVVTLYYNPYNESKHVRFLPDRSCRALHKMGAIITGAINEELRSRAEAFGFTTADFGPEFDGHGAGAEDSYLFGSDCELVGALTAVDFDWGWPPIDGGATFREVKKRFDPHPNSKGTEAQARVVLEAIR